MSTVASPPEKKLMTIEEFLALPDDGVERWLLRGELRPSERVMTVRNRSHSEVEARICSVLLGWLDRQPEPRGKIHSGEAGFRLGRNPDTLFGIDVAYASPELVSSTDPELPYYEGPPVLAVEILSPSDKNEDIVKKVYAYLKAGVVVWEVDPGFRRVSVHRAGQVSRTFSGDDELSTEPELPGFRVPVSRFFGA
jgi:Uma2 family endonuclease